MLPAFGEALEPTARQPYGARSEAAVFVGDLLSEEVPALAHGDVRIAAIARRPGVLSKVAVRAVLGDDAPVAIVPVIGADAVARVRQRLDGERIQIVTWHADARRYIADALGLGEVRPTVVMPAIGHAHVLLGEIDLRGVAGWRGLNVVLASALTGWRIRLKPISATAAWQRLDRARRNRTPLVASVIGPAERGLRVDVLGLPAVLPGRHVEGGGELRVRVRRLDGDEGRIFVTDRLDSDGQLHLPLAD